MSKKLLLFFVVAAMMLFTISGCNKSAQESSSSGNTDGKIRVAYIARAQADSFAAWLANSIKEEAAKYPNIVVDIFDGQANDDVENSLIENAIINKYDVIIIQPNNGEAQRPYAEKVVAAGIICLTTNARIAGIAGASSVDADPYKQAAVNAIAALEQIPQGANVVVLNGPPGNFHADERRRSWQIEFFDKRPDVKIVGEQIANWNKDEALSFMETWVQANDKIDAVISMNDNMAAGALEAVKGNPKFDNLLVYGVDGTAEACLLIKEGKMTSTCMQSAYDLSTKILDTVNKLVTKEATQIDTDIDNPLVTKENVDQYIEMYKKTGAIS
ncbi:sugar ABC transporter substrate-binding protein [Brachyspira pilosicoli]|uniref:sugar ABC transporter substrate-binding protein n=1 Tax=Brachyspira pilosicoli TaxID=52584 RepID=UPI001C67BC72|nr:sugar ABC transporter substrate-binding protein [Brachyspira pilosicoli]MBW5398017.1 sugar ABC transporter substrate-binding protein [Brachyspira pilosicoli]